MADFIIFIDNKKSRDFSTQYKEFECFKVIQY